MIFEHSDKDFIYFQQLYAMPCKEMYVKLNNLTHELVTIKHCDKFLVFSRTA